MEDGYPVRKSSEMLSNKSFNWTYQKIYEWADYPGSATDRTKGLLTASRERVIGTYGSPEAWLESKFFYDDKGRLVQSYTKTDPRGSYMHSQFLLAWNGDLLKQKDTHNYVYYDSQYGTSTKATTFLTEHEYDHGSRPTKSIYTLSDKNETIRYFVDHTYDTMGRLMGSIFSLGGYNQIKKTFKYNIRNWTENINYTVGGVEYFDLVLGYESNSAAPQFSGNISSATWQIGNMGYEKYDYRYDELSRLTRAYYSPSSYFTTAYQYDLNGNITNLARKGFSTAGAGNMVLADLEYSYQTSSNKLSRVDNLAPEGHGGLVNFEPDGFHNVHLYDYDKNGNMTKDHRRDLSVRYNFLNLPWLVENMVSGQYIEYNYTASGVKLSQEVSSLQKGGVGVLRQYAGPFVYINNELAWINTPEGRVVNQHFGIKEPAGDAFAAEFHLRDHLGNTRVVLLAEGGQYSVDGFSDYYPFGMQMREEWEMPYKGDLLTNRYLYNGKEMQNDMGLGWYDYGARFYDAQIGRWHSVDPHAEKYSSLSPYAYVFNNPINAIDPDGRDGILVVWKNYPAGGYKFTGHAGVLLIDNKTGLTKYYEYGRYGTNHGKVNHYAVPDVVMGDNGRPTAESLNEVMSFITERSGTKDGKQYEATGAYFESDKFKEMNDYAQGRLKENADPEREAYSTLDNNCGDFASETLKQDESIKKKSPLVEMPNPILQVDQYQNSSDYNLQYTPGEGTTIRYPEQTVNYNQQNNQTSSSQNWWQKLWYGGNE